MRHFLLAVSFVYFSLPMGSQAEANEQTPNAFIIELIEAFNSGDLDRYQSKFHYPYSRIINGKIQIFDDPSVAAIDYVGLRETGWVRSRINSVSLLDKAANSAVVLLDFSRMNADGNAFLSSKVFYTLVRTHDSWKVISGTVASSAPVNADE